MAVTQNTYTGDGSTTNFAFTFPYLAKADVKVKLDGTTRPTSEYTWFNATTIQMNTAPASGVVVLIYRDTSNDSKTGTFYAGSMIKAEDLNNNFDQILYVAQEVSNNSMSTLGTAEMQGDLVFGKSMGIVFEGDTNDAFETTLKVVDPTADRSVNLPNASGTLVSTGDTGTVTSTMLADATITTADIANNAITTAKIAAQAVTADEIANATITSVELAADCVNGTKIADNSINSEHYVDGSIDLAHMSANSVDSDQYVDGSIDLIHMSANSVDSDQYVDGSIDTAHIADSQVTTAKLADVNVTTAKIANDAVTNAKIADDQIDSEHYVDGSIDTAHIADSQITTDKIADDAITNAKIGALSVGTAELGGGQVTDAKLAANSVTTTKLAADAVTNAKIADDSIDSEHYVDGSIDTAHIADDQVTVGKLNIPRVETLAGMTSTTASTLAAATDLSASITNLNITQGMTKATSLTTSSDTEFPTSKAVNDRILTVTNALGGFVAIADKDNFPTAHPDPSGNAGTVVSISDAAGISVNSSGVGSLATRAGGSDAVIINGFPSALRGGATVGSATNADPYVLPSSVGLQVQTTTTAHTYDYHKYFINEEDANKLSGDIQDFQERYRVAASAPTASKDDGDLWFDTTNNKMMVYDATASAWADVATPGNFSINTISSYSGTGGNSATFNGTAYRFVLSNPPTQNAAQMVVSINGVIQKPNAGTSQPGEGFVIDGSSIIFSNAPATGSDYFIITIGNSVDIGTPSDNVITTAMLQNSAVTTAKITNDAIDGTKIADDAVGAEHIEVLDANLQLADSVNILLGTDQDYEIYHNGDHAYLKNNTGNFHIATDGYCAIYGGKDFGTTSGKFIDNGAVELYYAGTKKFETTDVGVQATGHIFSTTKFRGNDDVKVSLGTSEDLQLYHDGSYSYIKNSHAGGLWVSSDLVAITNGAVSENMAKFIADGAVELYHNHVKKLETFADGIKAIGQEGTSGAVQIIADDGDDNGDTWEIRSNQDVNDLTFRNDTGGSLADILTLEKGGNTWLTGGVFIRHDSKDIHLGAGDDLIIGHNGSDSTITNGTGNLRVRNAGEFQVTKSSTENMLIAKPDGAVELYYDNAKKFETNSSGCQVTGTLWADGIDTGDNEKLLLGDGDDLQIYHDGSHSYIEDSGTGELRIRSNQFTVQNAAGTETLMYAIEDGAVGLKYNDGLKFETASHGASVIDDELRIGTNSNSGSDCLIRLGSHGTDTDTHAVIAYDATNNRLSMIVSGESHGSAGLQVQNGGSVNSASFGPHADNTYNMGATLNRWSTIYAQNALNTSDRNLKNTIQTSDLGLSFINQLNPVSYKFNLYEGQVQDTRTHYGLIAQEVEDVIKKEGKTTDDFAAIVAEEGRYNLAYSEMISPLVKAVQELSAEVETLKTKVAALEAA